MEPVAVAICAAGVASGYHRRRVFRRLAIRRVVQRLPALTERSVEGSVIRATGTVRAARVPLIAPWSGRPCVAFCVRMWIGEMMDVLDMELFARTPHTLVEAGDLELELRSGEIVTIDRAGSHLDLALPRAKRSSRDRERMKQFLARHPVPPGRVFRTHECIVAAGDVITAAGALVRDPQRPAGEIAFRNEPETRSRIIGDPQRWIRIVESIKDS